MILFQQITNFQKRLVIREKITRSAQDENAPLLANFVDQKLNGVISALFLKEQQKTIDKSLNKRFPVYHSWGELFFFEENVFVTLHLSSKTHLVKIDLKFVLLNNMWDKNIFLIKPCL